MKPTGRALLMLAALAGAAAGPAGATATGAEPAGRWSEAEALERSGHVRDPAQVGLAVERFQQAGELYESIAQERREPAGVAEALWRGARSYWLAADFHPREPEDERLQLYERAETLAARGIETDPECGPCMLWKFSSMGRLATARGIWGSARQVREMASLLERGIALEPADRDDENGSVLAELHYSAAIFYRVIPDWRVTSWILGVRGDPKRSWFHIQRALHLHPERLGYHVELGSQLLCRGTRGKDGGDLAQGRRVMEDVLTREPASLDEEREIAAAGVMLEEPEKACGYDGDTWVELGDGPPDVATR